VRANVLDTIDEIKSIAQYLMPNSLFAFGLAAALRQRTELIQSLSGLHIIFEENLGDARFDEELEVSAFRIVQEGLNNILKHAHAKRCWVRVKRIGSRLVAIVADDGRGFDPRTSGDARSNGLFFMRERAELLGGRLRIRSRPGRGSRLEFSTPLR
jgi:signal transduction histidine kinase